MGHTNMSSGYVIFSTQADFDVAHAAAKTAANLPKVGNVNGHPAIANQQTTEITSSTAHPTNDTVVAFINGGWDVGLKAGFIFKTKEEVADYFPPEDEI
jgi:hypothetical protein